MSAAGSFPTNHLFSYAALTKGCASAADVHWCETCLDSFFELEMSYTSQMLFNTQVLKLDVAVHA